MPVLARTSGGRRRRRPVALASTIIALGLVASSCGSRTTASSPRADRTSPQTSFPVTVSAANGRVTIPRRPDRIVSLSPTATEMLFAIGAGDQVVAVDANSNYPAGVPTTKLSGYEPNVEAIATYQPDLVVISNNPGNLAKSLAALSVPTLLEPAARTLDDSYAQIDQLGAVTGRESDAAGLVATMKSKIRRILDSEPTFDRPPTYYYELDQTYYSVTSDTFIGQVYRLLGLRNIADRAKGASSGYPQLSAEYIIAANPDIVFLADTKCCAQSEATVAARPGWNEITAVRTGSVIELDDDVASRWGPRVVDLLRIVARALTRLRQRVGA